MNDPNEFAPGVDQVPPPPPPLGFCQNCGRPLDHQSIRVVGPAVYCEPCLAARLSGTPSASPNYTNAAPGYAPVEAGGPAAWPPAAVGAPNPGLAALLGFIPGVGAMYNEQYAKGIIHLIVFAVLVSLTDANGIFGLFIAGWEFYMAIEAHHTAKARRDGLPLPNPFGLNDIGERLGFGKAWPAGPDVKSVFTDAAQAASYAASQATAQANPQSSTRSQGFGQGFVSPPSAAPAGWGAPADSYPSSPGGVGNERPAEGMRPNLYEPACSDAFGSQPPYTPVGGYGPLPNIATPPAYVAPISRFPAGAVWLIGLGCLFLLMTTGLFRGVNLGLLFGVALIGLGVWSFLRRMTERGAGLAYDGSPGYSLRVLRALRLAAWLVLIGVWFLLDSFHLLRMHTSWPLFVILAGVMTLLERVAYNSAAAPALAGVAVPSTEIPAANPESSPSRDGEKGGN